MLNVTTFLDANSRRLTKDIFHCSERNVSYNSKEILGIISHIARLLKDNNVNKGDRVIIYLENSPEYLFSFLATWRIGAVAVPTNYVLTECELDYIVSDSNAKVFITDYNGLEVAKNFNVNKLLINHLDEFKDSKHIPAAKTGFNDLCQIQYTSGTTGKPKGAMLTHGNWFTSIHNECDVLTLKQDDVLLCIYPMAHVGISWGISAMRSGALYIMMERYNIDDYLNICENKKVTILTGMPPVIHSLIGLDENIKDKLKTVRELISGGGPLHNEIWKKFHNDYGIPIINAYGLSETVVIGTGTVIRPEDYSFADKFQSVGHPVCFSEVKIVSVDDSSKELNIEEHGEIALRGSGVAKGYWNMPTETKKSFISDGWFLTGDIGYLDKDLRLCITDRKKDMIVMSGWKIYPTEVEDILIRYKDVKELGVFGIPNMRRGEIPAVAVVWNDNTNIKEKEENLLIFARKYLANYKVPRKIFTIKELPRVNGWKLLRKSLKEKFSN